METTIRCKVRVTGVTLAKGVNGQVESERVQLQAVTNDTPENKEWSRWTPSANFDLTITNPAAFGKLSSGHEFYVDFIPA